MSDTNPAWFAIVDSHVAHLMLCSRTPQNRLHFEQRASLEEEWEEYQHGRPSSRAGKSGHSYASDGHEREERMHRFAKEVGQWLERQVSDNGVERIHVFCPARFLGELRKVMPARVQPMVVEREADLTHLGTGDLAKHAAVLDALSLEESA